MRRSLMHIASGICNKSFFVVSALSALAIVALSSSGLTAQASARTPAAQTQFKGVFEPVSYTEDIDLVDVFFVNPNVGWAAGKAGTIIRTTNGGAAWTAQLGGDPQGTAEKVRLIRFVGERHGWAIQGIPGTNEKILRTTDGESWEEIGTPPRGITDLAFTSTTLGFAAVDPPTGSSYSGIIYRTTDGGRTWKNIWTCSAKVSLGGLNRQVGCRIAQFHFVTPAVGYAVARSIGFGMGSEPPPLVAKTSDGGVTWEAVLGPGTADQDGMTSVFFLDARTGFARLTSGKLHMTTDRGATWRGIIASPGETIRFADPSVGWGLALDRRDFPMWYTTDGGSRWNSRVVVFPTTARALSFPRRDRAYIVGDNGMVFRYSVVPASRALGPNDILAPAMPAFESALDEQVTQLEQVVAELRSSLISASAGAPAGAAANNSADGAAVDGYDASSDESLTAPLTPPSTFTANCCKKSFSRLEVILGAMSKTLPEFIGKYKNLNLLLAAVRMGAELPNEYRSVKGGLSAFRKAQDKEGATTALSAVSAALSSFKQTTAVSMQKQLPPGGG